MLVNRRIIVIGGSAAAVLVLLAGYFLIRAWSGTHRQEYPTAKVVKRDLGATVQATGIVKPLVGADVKVGARTPGKVVELPINVGDKVAVGQVIAKVSREILKGKAPGCHSCGIQGRGEAIRKRLRARQAATRNEINLCSTV
jgi:macrolide-specific efflux system membrane fusion protein